MTDIKSKEARSRNMAAIKGSNTKPEKYICSLLFRKGYRFRKNVNYIVGHPDLFLRKYNTAIFVHGCFWHRHPGCKYAYIPRTRLEFWENKFSSNIKRDTYVKSELNRQHIKMLIIWECTVREMQRNDDIRTAVLRDIEGFLVSDKEILEL